MEDQFRECFNVSRRYGLVLRFFTWGCKKNSLLINYAACIEMDASTYRYVLPCSRFARGFEVVFQ